MTSSLFGLVDAAARHQRWARADDAVPWAMNAGLVVFALGLLADVTVLKRIGAPVMGTAILVGIATMATRLVGPPGRTPLPTPVPTTAH